MSKLANLHLSLTANGIDCENLSLSAIKRLQGNKQITDLEACNLQVQTEEWQRLKEFSKTIYREKRDG